MLDLAVLVVVDGIDRNADPVNWVLSIVAALIGLGAIVDAFYPWLRQRRGRRFPNEDV